MKLSTRSTYGMRALVELAIASGRGPVSATWIAKRQDLSVAYLEQLLHRLKKQGLISSIRGPRGGYVLAKPPQQITMADVVRVLDGGPSTALRAPSRAKSRDGGNGNDEREAASRAPANGRRKKANGTAPAKELHRHAARIAHAVWRCVHERITESLGAVTLQDLHDEVRTSAGEPLDHRYVFHI